MRAGHYWLGRQLSESAEWRERSGNRALGWSVSCMQKHANAYDMRSESGAREAQSTEHGMEDEARRS
ncbi:hypothetical protein TgHK011_000948 [Trichoderma gracile]|nr:hypothetical protein TgHK011_000948 [Trichoderma gracile]